MNEDPASTAHERHAWSKKFFSRLQRYRNLLLRRWWVVVICVVLALGIEAIKFRFTPPEYVSVGQMIVSIKVNTQQGSLYSEEWGNFLGTQAALMQGTEVLSRAREYLANQNPGASAQNVSLQVSVLPRTTIFVLRATGENPKYTKAYLQACMEEYRNLKKGMAERASDTTITGLTDQMLRLDPEMRRVDDQIASFLSTNDVTLLEEASGVANYLSVLYQRLAESESEYDLLQSMTLDQNLLLEQDRVPLMSGARMQSSLITDNEILANASLGGHSTLFAPSTIGMQYLSIKQQILLLKAEQDRFGQYLKPKHPKMVALNEESEKLGRMLEIYRDQSVEQLEAKKSALALQIKNIQNQTKQLGRQKIELGRKNAEYNRLKAKSQRLQSLYDQLLATFQTLDVNKDISPDTVTIYQPASDAFPDKTLLKKGLAFASLVGLGLGLAILMLMDRVDDRMVSFTELEELFEEDVLGQIPREKSPGKNNFLPLLQPDDLRHPLAESYRNLRSSLLYMTETGKRPHTLLITSSVPNDGKSVTAANLAITLATGGSRVLLVDADLRKGILQSRFKIHADIGLSESLSQNLDWRKAVKETTIANLFLLPRGAATQHSSELFISQVMEKFLKETVKEYDYVLIDTAPVMAADDVTSLAPRVDGVIFVVRAEFTSARVARTSLDMLYQRKARVLGLVFNSVRPSTGNYYYRYQDYYSTPPGK
ncbi:MAG: polysaccharide biosynthesis tyrosine autokinase [Limisphaerales bacterium]